MSIFRKNIDRDMVNTGTKVKPFISAAMELREYFCGPVRYCSVRVEKRMESIGDESRPYYVKVYELRKVKVLGIKLQDTEQVWKYDKF